jgi:citrate lyase synthetase
MDDIASFVRAETQDLIRSRQLLRFSINKEELKETVIEQITKGAGGMYVLSRLTSPAYFLLI